MSWVSHISQVAEDDPRSSISMHFQPSLGMLDNRHFPVTRSAGSDMHFSCRQIVARANSVPVDLAVSTDICAETQFKFAAPETAIVAVSQGQGGRVQPTPCLDYIAVTRPRLRPGEWGNVAAFAFFAN